MKAMKRITILLLVLALLSPTLPTASAETEPVGDPGNTDLYILNGGIMAQSCDDFYYSEGGGVYVSSGGSAARLLTDEDGANLNVIDGYVYYTMSGGTVRRVPVTGGEPETVYQHTSDIRQLYVYGGGTLRFLAGGIVCGYVAGAGGEAVRESELTGVVGLIPTSYGDILLTGAVFDYTVNVNGRAVLSGVTGCYTDSGYLAVTIDAANYQTPLSRLFGSFDASNDLEEFGIHGTGDMASLFNLDHDEYYCEECEENAKKAVFSPLRTESTASALSTQYVRREQSAGQANIVKRARQEHEIAWTPLENRYSWGYATVFTAGTTYTGLPYGQPVNTGYVPWTISLDRYIDSVNNNASAFYTTYSDYNKIAPAYSADCSSFVSWAWGLSQRKTTYSLPSEAVSIGKDIYSLQVGDCMNSSGHVVLVTDVCYDSNGVIKCIEIMEETPNITRLRRYGEGSYALSTIQSYYLSGGYTIYRNPNRDGVVYTHNCNVPIDGDYCANCKNPAPFPKVTNIAGGKTVSLSHKTAGAAIYYTLDGSDPTVNGKLYSTPITVTEGARIRAYASTTQFSNGAILDYKVNVPQVKTPTASVTEGVMWNGLISAGSKVALQTESAGAVLYYTTDGTEPTESSAVYSQPIAVTNGMTIKVFGRAPGMTDSDKATFTFTVGKTHTITAAAGANGKISPAGAVSVLETSSQTFTITPNDGYEVSSVTVNGVNVGAVTTYTFKNITGNNTISAAFKIKNTLPFTDVKVDDWYYAAVQSAYSKGLVNGVTATTFVPNGSMTRGMFVTLLGRMAGVSNTLKSGVGIVTGSSVNIRKQPTTDSDVVGNVRDKYTAVQILGTSGEWYQIRYGTTEGYMRGDYIKAYNGTFKDVGSSAYYAPYVEWAYLCGIINGTSASAFSPDTDITRESMCVVLYNYAVKYGKTLTPVNGKATFSDDASISSWAKDAVYVMQRAGIVGGTGDGAFAPKKTATRAEVSKIITDFLAAT